MTDRRMPITNTNAVNDIRNRTNTILDGLDGGVAITPDEIRQMAADIYALAADSDHWHGQADYWRESYRLAKGLSDDELNAELVMDEATKPHPGPCRFPDSPNCRCS